MLSRGVDMHAYICEIVCMRIHCRYRYVHLHKIIITIMELFICMRYTCDREHTTDVYIWMTDIQRYTYCHCNVTEHLYSDIERFSFAPNPSGCHHKGIE